MHKVIFIICGLAVVFYRYRAEDKVLIREFYFVTYCHDPPKVKITKLNLKSAKTMVLHSYVAVSPYAYSMEDKN